MNMKRIISEENYVWTMELVYEVYEVFLGMLDVKADEVLGLGF